jgi:hypothetical protein
MEVKIAEPLGNGRLMVPCGEGGVLPTDPKDLAEHNKKAVSAK